MVTLPPYLFTHYDYITIYLHSNISLTESDVNIYIGKVFTAMEI